MIRCDAWLAEHPAIGRMVMQVHDELVFEIADEHLAESKEAIRCRMEEVAMLSVPLVVDIGTGRNWDQAH